ncbi:MAG: hypothetical protein E7430_03945 [Ruminococcaceae bacterium]|nr:hypothetical protein [Oscillospiraceae bacterium]
MNTESNRLMELYIRKVLREVQAGKPTKNKIRSQLEDHILCAVEDSHLPPEKAVKQAVKGLGDPITIGKEYNRTYAIHMGFADWARLMGPWLVAPLFALAFILDLIEYNIIFSSWVLLSKSGLYALITGTFIGERFSKKTLCIYSCILPPIVFLAAVAAAHYATYVLHSGAFNVLRIMSRDLETIIGAVLWVFIFSMSCLWQYSEIAFTTHKRKTFQSLVLVILVSLMCVFLGLSLKR